MSSDIVSIKGTRNGLLIIIDPNCDYEEIRKTLLRKMESARGFFKGAMFTLSQGHQEIPASQRDELESICQQYGLIPNTGKAASIKTNEITEYDTDISKPACKTTSVSAQSDIGEAALLVRRSLRSGQRITHEGHIIVLGDIHPGAEVISNGNVLVIGSCRGMVHAGAGGNVLAKIIARRLEPISLSIAGNRLSQELSKTMPKECQVVRLSGTNFVFEKLQTGH